MQPLGLALLITVIIFFVGAFSAAYFRVWPHTDARQELALIAEDPLGWTAQAVIFPLGFLVTAVIFGLVAARLPEGAPRWIGLGAALLFGVGGLLWVPISLRRLRFLPAAAALLKDYRESQPVAINIGGQTFWPHTYCVLAGAGLMGAALALGGALPLAGWVHSGLVLLSVGVIIPRWGDWLPFFTYLFLLAMAIGLMT